MKAKSTPKLKVRHIAGFKKQVKTSSFWDTDPITVTTLTLTHIGAFNN